MVEVELSEQEYILRIIRRLRTDTAVLSEHNAWLDVLVEHTAAALRMCNYARVSKYTDEMTEWLRADYVNRAHLIDTIQILKLFCWWQQIKREKREEING